ncbi:MAG: DUF3387 domain-containing protein [Undibacterium sp.]|nr:DUF3387 domain-containing protein [Opitutaceae bacterium]
MPASPAHGPRQSFVHRFIRSALRHHQLEAKLCLTHAIATHEVIAELIKLAKQLGEADKRGVDHGLSHEEIAFCNALATISSAKEVRGDGRRKAPRHLWMVGHAGASLR